MVLKEFETSAVTVPTKSDFEGSTLIPHLQTFFFYLQSKQLENDPTDSKLDCAALMYV